MNGDFIYMLKDLRKSETATNVVHNNRLVKVNNNREIHKMQKEHMLQVSSVKKSQEAIYKTLVRVNRDKIKATKERFANTQEDLRSRTQKLRLKLLVRKVVEKFRENVQEKNLDRRVITNQSDGNEIKVKISSIFPADKKEGDPTSEEEDEERPPSEHLEDKDSTTGTYNLVTQNNRRIMVGQLSRPTSRSSFEDAITAEYLDRENEAYRDEHYDENDHQMTNEGGIIITEIGSPNGKAASPPKRTIVVTLPNLSSDCNTIKKKKDNVTPRVRASMKCKELYDFEVKETKPQGKKSPNRIKSGTSSSSGGSYKMDDNNTRMNRLNDLPSLKVTLDQLNSGTYSAVFQNTNNMLNKVEHFLNTSIKPASDEDYPGTPKEGERFKHRKTNVRNSLLDASRKSVGRSIPMVRAEDTETEKLSVIGLNPKNNDNMEGRTSALSANSVNSSNSMSRRMSIQCTNRRRAKAKQERFPKLQENVDDSKEGKQREGPPIVFLDTKIEKSVRLEKKTQRKLIKSERAKRELQVEKMDKFMENLPQEDKENQSPQLVSTKQENRKQTEVTPTSPVNPAETTESEVKKPSNMSDFVYRVFLRQNQFARLPSYMDPNSTEALRHCRYLRHYKRMNQTEKIAARYARNSCWQSKPFSVQEEFRALNRHGFVPSSAY